MRKIRQGFTIIEVSIFLAITGLLFLGVTMGVQNSIYWQRYNDTTQSFAEFLREVYSQVLNVQSFNISGGRSDEAMYGKLVTFGESGDKIYVYSLIGKADFDGTDNKIIKLLDTLKVSVTKSDGSFRGAMESYVPKWGSKIAIKQNGGSATINKGMLLVVRHPVSGLVHTYFSSNLVAKGAVAKFETAGFAEKELDFCIDVTGQGSGTRSDVRLDKNARNASGVEVIATDGDQYRCAW